MENRQRADMSFADGCYNAAQNFMERRAGKEQGLLFYRIRLLTDLEEQVNQKTLSMGIQSGKSVGKVLEELALAYLRNRKSAQAEEKQNVQPQKVKVKDLVGNGNGVSSIEIKDEDIRTFERTARKYGVKYAITKDRKTSPPTYYFFFQAKDSDVIDRAFRDFLGKTMKRSKKPTIAETLKRCKEIAASVIHTADKLRNKENVR